MLDYLNRITDLIDDLRKKVPGSEADVKTFVIAMDACR